ncbi:MAG: helix-turn-helix domain-containing protein [Polyangiaceae bacterium]
MSELHQLQALLDVPARLDELKLLVEHLVESLDGGTLPERPLTKKQLAAVLSVSDRTVDTLRTEGLPCFKVGSSPRFLLSEVIKWLRQRDRSEDGLRLIEGGDA